MKFIAILLAAATLALALPRLEDRQKPCFVVNDRCGQPGCEECVYGPHSVCCAHI
ncbi:unnamed protein product [Cercospora beticola]|nr:unnamed protein product [Cercospora beticola]